MQGHGIGIRVVIGWLALLPSACGAGRPQVMPAPMRVGACAPHGYCFDWEQHVRALTRAYGSSDGQAMPERGPELDLPVQPPLLPESDIKGRWSGVEPPAATRRPRTTEEVLAAFAQRSGAEPERESATVKAPAAW